MSEARAPAEREAGGAIARRFLVRPEAPALVFLAVLLVAFTLANDRFLTPSNLESIVDSVAVLGVVALAVNQVVLSGEIDISTGSMLGLCAVAAGAVALSTGGIVVPLLLVTGGTWITGIPESTRFMGTGKVLGISVPVVILFGLFLMMELVNRHSTWGRNVFAVGGNRRAARFAGLPVNRVRFAAFALVGVFVGIASLIYLGRAGSVQTNTGVGLELQVVAAVVIGGTSIAGGRGSSLAALTGAVLIGVILNGLILLGVPGIWQDAVLGALILLAVATDVLRRRIIGDKV
jgi:rhamnose transport system permease protein